MVKTRAELVAEARATVIELHPDEVRLQIDQGEIDLILDIREADDWKAEHIPGSRHTPRGRLEWLADPTYEHHDAELAGHTEKRIVVYCGGGGRSVLAARKLDQMGYTNIATIKGGFRAWKELRHPVIRPAQQEPMNAEIAIFWRYIASSMDRLVGCVTGLDQIQLSWVPPSPGANSLGILAMHALGNAEENLLGILSSQKVKRDRASEFGRNPVSAAIEQRWKSLRQRIDRALVGLNDMALDQLKTHPRRGTITGREVMLVVARHAAEHLGQAELTRDLMHSAQARKRGRAVNIPRP